MSYEDFINKLDSDVADFYDEYTYNDNVMPMYGNDCSGFLSGAWNIKRTDTQTFLREIKNGKYSSLSEGFEIIYRSEKEYRDRYIIDSYDADIVKKGFDILQTGDALIRKGHVMLVNYVDTSNQIVYVFEQTGLNAKETSYSYDYLTEALFIPFTKY